MAKARKSAAASGNQPSRTGEGTSTAVVPSEGPSGGSAALIPLEDREEAVWLPCHERILRLNYEIGRFVFIFNNPVPMGSTEAM